MIRKGEVHGVYDLVGVGFGPSNLALAVAVREIAPGSTCLFVERSSGFDWHPGMMLDSSHMQISFLKDLVTLRNTASPYTFLNYLKVHDRLERFVNHAVFRPSRLEYRDYLRWVAADFADQVRYATEVVDISPHADDLDLLQVRLHEASDGTEQVVHTRNVVIAGGGTPRIPDGVDRNAVIHSSEVVPTLTHRLTDLEAPHRVVLVGDGQSAAEIARHVLTRYTQAQVDMVVPGETLSRTDDSPFINEHFFAEHTREFHQQEPDHRARRTARLRASNYGAVDGELLDELYRLSYLDEVRGRSRLIVHPYSRLVSATGGVAVVEHSVGGQREQWPCDALVLATGYHRDLDERLVGTLHTHLGRDERGLPLIDSNHRVTTRPQVRAGVYVQGFGEHAFGIGDTLLSLLPFRSEQIIRDIVRRKRPGATRYPSRQYLEHDRDQLYATVERFAFATLVSARDVDEPLITQVPVVLDRSGPGQGTLFGHLDRANPHVDLLDGRPIQALFHGPNSYISPALFDSTPLPTWNSITVRVRGRVRVVHDRTRLVDGLYELARRADRVSTEPPLRRDDPRIDHLLPHIVGFEIDIEEIVGRFKLSQDRDPQERRLAGLALAEAAERSQRRYLGSIIGVPLDHEHLGSTGSSRHTAQQTEPVVNGTADRSTRWLA